ncbi:hypothetical protein GCM10010385_47920 [Streptomyces geysiriensis]|nr:hypothetical protein GCM10010385_47920 [Streptomyces geysiriensis]
MGAEQGVDMRWMDVLGRGRSKAGRRVRHDHENPFMTTPGELVVFYPSPRATPTATDTPP